jgi:hypothetical protein
VKEKRTLFWPLPRCWIYLLSMGSHPNDGVLRLQ